MLRNRAFGGGICPCCPQCKLVELGTDEQGGQGQGKGHGVKDPEHKEGGGWSCKVRQQHPDVRDPFGHSWRGWEQLHLGLHAAGQRVGRGWEGTGAFLRSPHCRFHLRGQQRGGR